VVAGGKRSVRSGNQLRPLDAQPEDFRSTYWNDSTCMVWRWFPLTNPSTAVRARASFVNIMAGLANPGSNAPLASAAAQSHAVDHARY